MKTRRQTMDQEHRLYYYDLRAYQMALGLHGDDRARRISAVIKRRLRVEQAIERRYDRIRQELTA